MGSMLPASNEPAHHSAQSAWSQALLAEFGERLRRARLERDLGVSELARAAGLSRRHVTEAEAGRANPSLLKLAALAEALRLPLRELLDVGAPPALHAARARRIALVGLRGAGKSSVGKALALLQEAPFVELDQRIEERAGLSLAELFDLQGAEAFHRFETEALEEVLGEGRVVVAAPGSIVEAPASYERLLGGFRTVWLRATPEEHYERVWQQGDRRPMRGRPRALEELRALLERRSRQYARCELTLDTSGRSVEELARELAERLAAPQRELRG